MCLLPVSIPLFYTGAGGHLLHQFSRRCLYPQQYPSPLGTFAISRLIILSMGNTGATLVLAAAGGHLCNWHHQCLQFYGWHQWHYRIIQRRHHHQSANGKCPSSFYGRPVTDICPAGAGNISYFNFRQQAKCFAGDVGSISIAFIILFGMGYLILQTKQPIYILFLAVYGVDSVLTIILRIRNRENIFKPHRSHLYQLLTNERGLSQRWVAAGYAGLQFGINYLIIWAAQQAAMIQLLTVALLLIALITAYFLVRVQIGQRLALKKA